MQIVRFIVIGLDTKTKDHKIGNRIVSNHIGHIFSSKNEALEYLNDNIDSEYIDKVIIGSFIQSNDKEIYINDIQTFGFSNNLKSYNQLKLF